jgi:hypothetical protein
MVTRIQFDTAATTAVVATTSTNSVQTCKPAKLTRRQRKELRHASTRITVPTIMSIMAVDDVSRVEPLIWCGAELTHTLTATFTLTEPRTDSSAVHQWAMHTHLKARPTFIVNRFAATRSRAGLRLTDDARRMLTTANAGGNSALSEALALDVLRAAYGATLDRTEMQIRYWCTSKITDFSILLCGVRVGVSVSRACCFRGAFTVEDATRLLRKKLGGVNESTAHVITPHQWRRQILMIWAQRESVADILACAYARLPVELRADTLVLVTVARHDPWIFFGDQDEV